LPLLYKTYTHVIDSYSVRNGQVIINHWSLIGAGFGMGHMITLDGKSYRLGARGQFWIIRGGGFLMQGETVGMKGKIHLN